MAKKAVGPGYPVRAYDEEGNDVLPQEVQFKFSGGGIDLGDLAAPHVGRPVQGTWKGTVRGGGIVRDDSRVKLVYTVSVEGLTGPESDGVLGLLFKHMLQDQYIYRHRWQAGMVLMWDNRCTMHLAEGGYDGHLRLMHRTTVAGDTPV